MPTANRALETPARGSLIGTWDVAVNGNSAILDAILGSTLALGLASGGSVSLSATQAQSMALRFTGAIATDSAVNLPQPATYIVENLCTGAGDVLLQDSGGGEVIGLPKGRSFIFNDGTNVRFIDSDPTGTFKMFYGATVPTWITKCTVQPWLPCDGSTFSAVTYPALNALLGGNTLPDFRGRLLLPIGGSTAGRVTAAGSGINGDSLGAAGGAQDVTLDVTQIPAHNHDGLTGNDTPAHTHEFLGHNSSSATAQTGSGVTGLLSGTQNRTTAEPNVNHRHAIATQGGGLAHNNMPPAIVAGVMMIKT